METYFGYTRDELTAMSIDELNLIDSAAYALQNACANYGDSTKNWTPGYVAMRHECTHAAYEITGVLAAKEHAIRRVWEAMAIWSREQQKDIDSAIEGLWRAIAEIARLHDAANLPYSAIADMQHYVKNIIWDNADSPYHEIESFSRDYRTKRTDSTRVKCCQKWAQANWTFGIPKF